eukprot:6178830-Pleurochrysis_carterae.AAC.1
MSCTSHSRISYAQQTPHLVCAADAASHALTSLAALAPALTVLPQCAVSHASLWLHKGAHGCTIGSHGLTRKLSAILAALIIPSRPRCT